MARNLIDLVEDDGFELFEKLGHSNKRRYNKENDAQERIKRQRRERRKMKEDAQREEL